MHSQAGRVQHSVNFAPGGVRSIVISMSVCLSVLSHNSNHADELQQVFVHVACGRAHLGPPLRALRYVMYFRFVNDVMLSHNGLTARPVYS